MLVFQYLKIHRDYIEIEEYPDEYTSVSSIIREVLPFEIIAIIGGGVAGIIFSGMTNELQLIPDLIVITPTVLGMHGNISETVLHFRFLM